MISTAGVEEPALAVRVGVAGVGRWGRNLVRVCNSLPTMKLRSVCDPNLESTRSLAQVGVFDRYEHFLSDASLDAVVIAAPCELHAPLALRALTLGKHVFVEKPMATSVHDAEELKAASERFGRVLMVGHILRYHPAIQVLKHCLQRGLIGELESIHTERTGSVASARDAIWTLLPHDVALVAGFGLPFPTVLTGKPTALGGVHAELEAEGVHIEAIARSGASGKRRSVVLKGTRGTLTFDDGASVKHAAANGRVVEIPFDDVEPLVLEMGHFADAIAYGNPVLTNAREGVEVTRVLTELERLVLRHPGGP